MHYSDYLQLEKILDAQHPESDKLGIPAHDEMLFIVIHQAYELWFRQLLYETDSIIALFGQPALNDNSPELQTIVHRLSRCVTILKVLGPSDRYYGDHEPDGFPGLSRSAAARFGFPELAVQVLEARLGLKYEHRVGKQYYLSQLRQEEIDRVKAAENAPTPASTAQRLARTHALPG